MLLANLKYNGTNVVDACMYLQKELSSGPDIQNWTVCVCVCVCVVCVVCVCVVK